MPQMPHASYSTIMFNETYCDIEEQERCLAQVPVRVVVVLFNSARGRILIAAAIQLHTGIHPGTQAG